MAPSAPHVWSLRLIIPPQCREPRPRSLCRRSPAFFPAVVANYLKNVARYVCGGLLILVSPSSRGGAFFRASAIVPGIKHCRGSCRCLSFSSREARRRFDPMFSLVERFANTKLTHTEPGGAHKGNPSPFIAGFSSSCCRLGCFLYLNMEGLGWEVGEGVGGETTQPASHSPPPPSLPPCTTRLTPSCF